VRCTQKCANEGALSRLPAIRPGLLDMLARSSHRWGLLLGTSHADRRSAVECCWTPARRHFEWRGCESQSRRQANSHCSPWRVHSRMLLLVADMVSGALAFGLRALATPLLAICSKRGGQLIVRPRHLYLFGVSSPKAVA
jgi:hypothetical protein